MINVLFEFSHSFVEKSKKIATYKVQCDRLTKLVPHPLEEILAHRAIY